jgi:hypothetical protein
MFARFAVRLNQRLLISAFDSRLWRSNRTPAVEQLQIRRRPARALTEIAIENTATDGKC